MYSESDQAGRCMPTLRYLLQLLVLCTAWTDLCFNGSPTCSAEGCSAFHFVIAPGTQLIGFLIGPFVSDTVIVIITTSKGVIASSSQPASTVHLSSFAGQLGQLAHTLYSDHHRLSSLVFIDPQSSQQWPQPWTSPRPRTCPITTPVSQGTALRAK